MTSAPRPCIPARDTGPAAAPRTWGEKPAVTYCVGLRLDAGLVMLSDTRTNAGLDNISRFGKMFTWER